MDWDGTTSLTRAGWAEIMRAVYFENLPPAPGENDAERGEFAWVELMRLSGKPSSHQMAHLATLVRQRGGRAADAADYQAEFQKRLRETVQTRIADLRAGRRNPDDLLVPGVRALFETLRAHGIAVTVATGTPRHEILEEAGLLEVAHHFQGIHGPDDLRDLHFSKRGVIAGLLDEHGIEGAALLAFGDGPIEIAETKAVGGVAVAVAVDEGDWLSGRFDPWKRESLLAAGADAVVADFRQAPGILETILGR
jgi:phosphoglycolate phosphatase-like HAD superfamily hydrolase